VEGLFQEYGDRFKFLYMYVREAHPNPNTAPCGSTADLGWEHSSRNTVSKEERAQRARWLKHDFNLSFPYVIDEMSSEHQSVWMAFGFYAGWFVDCNREVHIFEPWAWGTPQTQWCGLPLADATEFETFLDAYLADPPSCYRGIDRSSTTIIPAVARVSGLEGTDWISDVTIANPHDEPVETEITYLPRDRDNADAVSHLVTIDAGHSLAMTDIVGETFATTGSGALVLVSELPQVVVSRTSNSTPEGTFGQFIQAFDLRMSLHEGQTGHLVNLEETASFRTNLGLVNPAADEVTVEVRLFGTAGDRIGVLTYSLPPRGVIQINRVLTEIGVNEATGVRSVIDVETGGGQVLAYASMVDNGTGDPVFQTASTLQ